MRRLAAFLLVLSACAPAQLPPPATTPSQAPVAVAATTPVHSPNALTPVSNTAPRGVVQPRIRVGLLSDQASVTFPRTTDGYYLVSSSGASILKRGFTVTAPLSDATVRYAIQASVISDARSAKSFADKIGTETGLRVDSLFDPASGAYRILAGDFATSDDATPVRAQLTERGYGKDMLVVRRPSDQPFEKTHRIIDDEGDRYTLTGDTLTISPVSADTVEIDTKPYRTSAQLFINARGLFNVVNVLNLEDYLYGVVPAEMGPTIYDELEALKAQAVAARTYAVRNLGQFKAEGYDICPGPACQAYKGFSGENDLSNQAVSETAGVVITYQGKLIDALYTATCGGETSDVGTMFPGRTDPYLKAARCIELDFIPLDGRADSGLLTEQQVNARLFASLGGLLDTTASWSAGDVETAVSAALRVAGAPATTAPRPTSSRRGDVLRYLAAVFSLDAKARTVTLPEDRKYYFPETKNPEDVPYLASAFLIKYGIQPAQNIDRIDLSQAMPREELYAILGGWLREMTLVQESNGKIFKLDGRRVTLKSEGKISSFTLPAGIPVFRRIGDRTQEYRNLPVLLGDRATVLLSEQKVPVGIIVQGNYDGAAFDRTSSFSNWTRSWRADELVPVINKRNPIQQLLDIKPLSVDASERVLELEVTAEGGRKFTLKGLPIRWSLNLPDNLFVYDKTKDPDGVD
ncbi:MAG TPA: SpoIID/LytB domain-containing protein, partial [Thermoanaerobaculia bacterium]|nr:SpoIID/LytB domain-containing protein [Thermoanaerobaculia bacterium]